jgi:hypothetical protein
MAGSSHRLEGYRQKRFCTRHVPRGAGNSVTSYRNCHVAVQQNIAARAKVAGALRVPSAPVDVQQKIAVRVGREYYILCHPFPKLGLLNLAIAPY